MKKAEKRRRSNEALITHKLAIRAMTRNPGRSNLSAIARTIGSTTAKLWFYINGYAKWPAEDFLKFMAAMGEIKCNGSGVIKLTLHISNEEWTQLSDIAKNDFAPTRTSAFVGPAVFENLADV